MSRRASLFAKENPGKQRSQVRFPDELVFLDNIKENDMDATYDMLRRASVTIDINGIGDSGMTPLHQAVLDGNMIAVRMLVAHEADINKKDEDTWTPLHAACAEGHTDIVRYLLSHGANKSTLTDDGERPIDLIDSQDFETIAVMLSHGRCSPPPRHRHDEEDDDKDDDDDDEEDGDDAADGGDEDADEEDISEDDEQTHEIKTPLVLPPPPLKSCLKSTSKLTIREQPAQEAL